MVYSLKPSHTSRDVTSRLPSVGNLEGTKYSYLFSGGLGILYYYFFSKLQGKLERDKLILGYLLCFGSISISQRELRKICLLEHTIIQLKEWLDKAVSFHGLTRFYTRFTATYFVNAQSIVL